MANIGLNLAGITMIVIGTLLMVHGADNAHSALGTLHSGGFEWTFWGSAVCFIGLTVLVLHWTR